MAEVEVPPPPEVSQAPSKPTIGIIYPPPELRNIVDKTASFVARNGPDFEARIRQNEINNKKFNFLNPGDPYNAYYQHKVKEFKEGKGESLAQLLGVSSQHPHQLLIPVQPQWSKHKREAEVSRSHASKERPICNPYIELTWQNLEGMLAYDRERDAINIRKLPLQIDHVPEPTAAAIIAKPSLVSKPAEIAKLTEIPVVPKEPPPEYEFVVDPPSISAFDLDIVKLTAQFVARNGRQFLTNLMNREQRNYQFDFLRPQHSLFNYFLKLLEQYTKILIPPKDLITKLKNESESPKAVLEQVRYRVEWTRHQEAIKRREEEEAERERIQYAQIDWHDFVVVETVDYQPNEQGLFPPPTTPEEVGKRVLQQQRIEEEGVEEVEMEVESEDEEEDSDREEEEAADKPGKEKVTVNEESSSSSSSSSEDEEEEEPEKPQSPPPLPPKEAPPQPPPLPPQPDQVVIRKDYNPKVTKIAQQAAEQYLISPITGEKIPADKMQEHMRIGLLDPRWVEQRDRAVQEKMTQEEVYAHGSAIESSLKQFAERRTDIFGLGVEETAIGKKIGEEEKKRPEKVTWDGHTASMEAATRAARANITIEEQIQQIHKIKGLLPDEEKERIGPSKPQESGLLSSDAPISSIELTIMPPTPATTAAPAPVPPPPSTSTTSTVAPPKPQTAAPPLPPTPAPVSTPSTTASQRPPMPPPPPMPVPPPVGAILPPRQLMPPPQGLILAPLPPPGPPPPHLLAMAPRPPLGPVLGPPGAFVTPIHAMPPPPRPPPPEPPATTTLGKTPASGPPDDEPAAKKAKTEESLIPEEEFLKKNKSPVSFNVKVPNLSEKPEWKLNGQMINMTLPLTDMVSVIKVKIHEVTSMPPGKQKLQLEGMFIKDGNTLAFYNICSTSVVNLQLKERGGRKK